MDISEKIYQIRKEKGYSQGELADKLNISRQAVSKWESGQSVPDPDKLILLSELFKVSIDELLKDEPPVDVSYIPFRKKHHFVIATIMCILGFAGSCCLALWTLLNSTKADQTAESIAINLNGYTLLCVLFAILFITGAITFCILHFLNRRK